MRLDLRQAVAAAAPALALAAALGGAAGLLAATMNADERAAAWVLVEPRIALVVMLWFFLALAGGVLLHKAWLRFGAAPGRLAEQVEVLLRTDAAVELAEEGAEGSRALARAVNALVQQRAALRADIDARVREASREVEQERNRLAALMAELTQSVVVCNLDGRILLFNQRARLQFRALADAPAIGGAEPIALGRSIYAVFDRKLVAHAIESVQHRLQRGAAHPAAQFVTGTRGGQLLRVQMAPVKAPDAGPDTPLAGFVLMLDNITRDFAEESGRDRSLHRFTEAARASLASLQMAVELLDDPGLDPALRERFQGVVRDEAAAMAMRITELAGQTAQSMKTRWPLEEMLGSDLVEAARRRIETKHRCRTAAGDVDGAVWLRVDSFSLLQALVHLAGRLVEEHEVRVVELRLQREEGRARLDLVWVGPGISTEIATAWETDPIAVDGEAQAVSVRDVVERHGGAFWFERERVRHAAFFRFLLPLADAAEALEAAQVMQVDSRPEYYDFDLFRATGSTEALAERRLAELNFTVFDTETTGLEPSAGDEILQIGATRIVAGKLRRQDCFEQLVDPGRDIPAAGIPIHGITPEMVAGQPTIDSVLTAFHAFAADTVLVAHNAAFDMRFLQLKEERTGLRFDQPVLDTLLLSAVVHPQQESHRLEAIAQRLGVTVLGRHTALGDAMVTAEVFLKLVPLLEAMGIHTLGQAMDAARKTWFARVNY